ncbi:glutathione S-transferase family protein [Pacificimonas sp. WHA3]|uniref:Glutathione S-transferase family protein n=1 Tax=Pacificimonas pallii TaxID=2827236 RepID=A0ABS6SDK9_9SPHN|nr:glutathione S-transferase family protein [Pacificimonas pallii]MBV7256431.1 glutathione S-transferase family protein [Pacificimonas pallii]
MLIVHHLRISQSERVVWLCEELGLDYDLKLYNRRQDNRLAPDELKALHPIQTAPIIQDGDLTLGESGAILQYITQTYGSAEQQAVLNPGPDDADYADHLFWFHWCNGTLMTANMMLLLVSMSGAAKDNPALISCQERVARAWAMMETRLGESDHFGGRNLTLADINIAFSLTTARAFREEKTSVADFPNIRAWLQRIGARDAYQRAMAKAEPGMAPVLS